MEHLESLRALCTLTAQDAAQLARGSEDAIAHIHRAFRALGTTALSPIFEHFGGAYPYETLRIARLMLVEPITQHAPASSGFETIRADHPHAYLPWDTAQDDQLRELFAHGSSVADLADTFHRTRGAIKSRLGKLGLWDD